MNWLALIVLTFVLGAGTVGVGWWVVPLVAFGWGLVGRKEVRPVWVAVQAGALSWGLILAWTSMQGPIGHLARTAAGAMGLPAAVLYLVTVAFPAVVAGAAAGLGQGIRRWRDRRRRPVSAGLGAAEADSVRQAAEPDPS